MSVATFRLDAQKQDYEDVIVLGKPMLFTAMRISRESVPKGLYLYEVRHEDESWMDPCQIGKGIMLNFYGTLISSQPIQLTKSPVTDNAYRDFESATDWHFEGVCSTLKEYMERHPPRKDIAQER